MYGMQMTTDLQYLGTKREGGGGYFVMQGDKPCCYCLQTWILFFPRGIFFSMTGDSVLFVLWYFMLCNICDGLKVAQGLSFQVATTNPYPPSIKDGFPVKGDPMVLLAAMQ